MGEREGEAHIAASARQAGASREDAGRVRSQDVRLSREQLSSESARES